MNESNEPRSGDRRAEMLRFAPLTQFLEASTARSAETSVAPGVSRVIA
jgi:hypothetical protein